MYSEAAELLLKSNVLNLLRYISELDLLPGGFVTKGSTFVIFVMLHSV